MVLSLILAEAALLAERGPAPPLLLLDDVLSELDEGGAGLSRSGWPGRTDVDHGHGRVALPAEPAQLVEVTPGVRGEARPHRRDVSASSRASAPPRA